MQPRHNSFYRNVELVLETDPGYRAYLKAGMIRKNKVKDPNRPKVVNHTTNLSKPLEYVVQHWMQSDDRRILAYQFRNGHRWFQSYRELDGVIIEGNRITICELKTSYCISKAKNKAIRQVSLAADVLSTIFRRVHKIVIRVDLSHRLTNHNITHQFQSNFSSLRPILKQSEIDGSLYGEIIVAPAQLFEYGIKRNLISNPTLLAKAVEEAERNYKNREKSQLEKLRKQDISMQVPFTVNVSGLSKTTTLGAQLIKHFESYSLTA